ncbi:two-component system, OmpR family, response regulator [Limimonas halophila]|uniref:Two-component system, OmpR family, response regulator n=1 Tax=Limimonas halophila TaxID=1082479 RepID=A0A1G7QL08_9PROT|nr:response regulator transcription factor [Limimonas halophila]SDF99165.1 two-component system, OmpR family, response regulator [Limimonas halophila]
MRILVVEDDPGVADLVTDGLRHDGYAVDTAAGVGEARDLLDVAAYDLLVLDLTLADRDGLELLRALRHRQDTTPVLVLTARGQLSDRVAGLDAGADDYLVKPFALDELKARCRALLRRPSAALGTVMTLGPIQFDTAAREAYLDGAHLDLGRRESALLEVLMRNHGQVVTRETLQDTLYSFDEAVTPNALEAAVSRLRRQLRPAGERVSLATVRGVGYILRVP